MYYYTKTIYFFFLKGSRVSQTLYTNIIWNKYKFHSEFDFLAQVKITCIMHAIHGFTFKDISSKLVLSTPIFRNLPH